ncbi:hypothetical protein RRG08_009108 [Elysia crispata]|uniref:GH18 domain-containing protein n=1 Tax=Elysia crispata TaxID=231223 RepID=A0AAE1DPM3_9GAST|nr:hypothetical protein RRG08_009108 [Elysia crispata]
MYLYFLQQLGCEPPQPEVFLHLYTCISSSNWAVYLLSLRCFSIYIPVLPPATGLCTCSACGVSPSIYLYFLQQLGCVLAPPVGFLHLYTCISFSNWAVYLLCLWGFSIYIPVFPPQLGCVPPQPEVFLHLYTCISSSNWAVYLLSLRCFSIYIPVLPPATVTIYIPVFPPSTGLCSCSACGVSPSIYLYFLQQLGCVPAPPVGFLHLCTCISSSNWPVYLLSLSNLAVFLLRLWGFYIYIPVFSPATWLCSCSACGVSPSIYLYFLQQLGCVPAPPVGFLHLYTCISSSNWAVFLLRLWGFDGLAVRWPPTAGPERLQKLLILLNSRFNEEFRSSKRGMRGQLERLKIAVLMDMNRGDWLRIYDMNSISSIVDQVTLEPVPSTSDQDGNVTRITQPLHSMTSAQSGPGVPAGVRLSIDEAIQMVVSSGVIRSKVNVAISLTGVEFRLKDPTNHSIGAETIGLTGPSRIFYFDMCSFINHAQLSRASSSDKSPYWYSGDRWVSGEDEESIAQKIEYLKRKSIGGVALFSQSEDDFSGKFCNRGKFPLSFKVFEDSNINSNRRLLLPWQRYCSGQSPLRVKARWCLGLHTVVTMVVVLWGCMPW